MTKFNDYAHENVISLRVENEDHNFMGKSIIESRQCSNPKRAKKQRAELMGIKRYKRALSNSIFCDKQITSNSFESPKLLIKYRT